MKILILLLFIMHYMNANQKITLQLNWLHQFQFAGYYVAKEKGYYKDADIDLEIKEIQQGLDTSNIIEKKEVDFAIARSSLLIERAKGKDIVALYSAFQSSPLVLLVTQDSNIKKLQDIKNKKIMLNINEINNASIFAMLSSRKISFNDIIIQDHTFNLNDLINKKTDIMLAYSSNEPLILDVKGIKYKVFDPKDYGFDFYSDILYTSSKFIKKNPKLTRDFYEATMKGWEYAFDNIAETSQLIHEKYNSQNKSLLFLMAEAQVLKKLAFSKTAKKLGSLDKTKLQKIVDVYKIMGLMQNDINLDRFIYKHNNRTILNIKLTKEDLIKDSLIAIIIIISLILIIFYILIKRKWIYTTRKLEKEIELKTQQLKEQNHTDSLTNAKNRKAYIEKINEHLASFSRYKNIFSLIILDIDDFKKVNDVYGHKAGDKVLINLVKIIHEHTRENDFLYRVGGEEFVIILSQTKLQDAIIVAQNIRVAIEEKLSLHKREAVTISLGLSEVKQNDTEDSLYTRTDTLLYHSKKHGKNRVSF